MKYNEIEKESTSFRIKLKGKSKDIHGRTPFENNEVYTLGRIEYIHNMADNGITIVTTYGISDLVYRYVSDDVEECLRMIEYISKSMHKRYTEDQLDKAIDRLLF